LNNYSIYKHVFPNGKVYIGITGRQPSERWNGGLGYRTQLKVWNAIKKYGWANIEHIVIAEGLTHQEACDAEVKMIALYNSTDKRFGYNSTNGGSHYEMTEEHRLKISAANKGKPSHLKGKAMDESRKRKISEANSGKHRTDEMRKRQSDYMKGKYTRGENPRARKVVCVETGTVFSCVTDAAEWAGVARASLTDAINGRSRTCANYHWKYHEKSL
jgi:group I intron endonuclease